MTKEQERSIQRFRTKGYSFNQIATALELPVSTVKSAYKRLCERTIEEPEEHAQNCCPQCRRIINESLSGHPKRFCSEACRRDWWKAHRQEYVNNTSQTLSCAFCGKPFSSSFGQKRKFCSHACYIKARFGEQTV